jgi:hypothetical protein
VCNVIADPVDIVPVDMVPWLVIVTGFVDDENTNGKFIITRIRSMPKTYFSNFQSVQVAMQTNEWYILIFNKSSRTVVEHSYKTHAIEVDSLTP